MDWLFAFRNRLGLHVAGLLSAAALGQGCVGVKPWEKEYLLDPLMDDGLSAALESPLSSAVQSRNERLAGLAPGSGGATSCPTCGG